MPTYKLNLPAAEIEAEVLRLEAQDYVLIKSKDFLKLFSPPALKRKCARRTPAPKATSEIQPEDPPPASAFTDLVLMTMSELGPASAPEILAALQDAEVPCDQKKVSGALTYLKKTHRAFYNPDKNQWRKTEER